MYLCKRRLRGATSTGVHRHLFKTTLRTLTALTSQRKQKNTTTTTTTTMTTTTITTTPTTCFPYFVFHRFSSAFPRDNCRSSMFLLIFICFSSRFVYFGNFRSIILEENQWFCEFARLHTVFFTFSSHFLKKSEGKKSDWQVTLTAPQNPP